MLKASDKSKKDFEGFQKKYDKDKAKQSQLKEELDEKERQMELSQNRVYTTLKNEYEPNRIEDVRLAIKHQLSAEMQFHGEAVEEYSKFLNIFTSHTVEADVNEIMKQYISFH